jgi:hypothetical protein
MSTIDSSALSLLRQALSPEGAVHLPGDLKYSNKRWALNAERHAAAVACPATSEDVVQILAFAQGKEPYAAQKRVHVAVKVLHLRLSLMLNTERLVTRAEVIHRLAHRVQMAASLLIFSPN